MFIPFFLFPLTISLPYLSFLSTRACTRTPIHTTRSQERPRFQIQPTMNALPSSKKTHSERHKQILKQLLKESPNKTCVDCKTAAHPRWASWNLGCFICIRCSGIHRLMGTHVSRVKSVDLDAWTDEQVELMVKWGNAKCNLYWEAKLPQGYVPDGLKIENFIRTKYDLKKWVGSSTVPDPMSLSVGSSVATKSGSGATNTGNVAPTKNVASTRSSVGVQKVASHHSAPASLLDDDFGSFTSSPLPTPNPPQQTATQATKQTLQSQKSGQTSATAAKVHLAQVRGVAGSQSTGNVPKKLDERTDLKKSILSLYSLPSSSLTSVQTPQQTYSSPSLYRSPYGQRTATNSAASGSTNGFTNGSTNTNVAAMSDSLMGLNFGTLAAPQSVSQPKVQPSQPGVLHSPPVKNDYKNEWNESSSSVNNWGSSVGNSSSSVASPLSGHQGSYAGNHTSNYSSNYTTSGGTNGLDDDLFKNVWS